MRRMRRRRREGERERGGEGREVDEREIRGEVRRRGRQAGRV